MIFYRVLISLFATATLLRALRKGGLQALRARLSPGEAPGGPHVWLHGASNGELASIKPVLEKLIPLRPRLRWLITANTPSGVRLAENWHLQGVTVRLAPVDLHLPTRRIMQEWQVCAHVALEAEIWPNRFLTCPGPIILAGARMSAGTAGTWARFPRLARRLLGRVRFASAQDTASAERLLALGLSPAATGPVMDLKAFYDAALPTADPDVDQTFQRDRTWLAASTHEGEEEVVLTAHAMLRRVDPGLRLIIAPRHPQRADDIIEEIRRQGLSYARRSSGAAPGNVDVYLADTLGEMPRWYACSGRVFIGGTLRDRGGHTPYEPAAFGAALIHGPDTRNFAAAFARLTQTDAASQIRDANSLAEALRGLTTADAQIAAGVAAQAALRQEADLQDLVTPILRLLPEP